MSTRGRSPGRALLLFTGLLAATATLDPGDGRAQPVWTRARQFPSEEPPLAEGPIPVAPGAALQRPVNHPPTPVVSIRVGYPPTVSPGRELEYRIVVENSSAADANHVKVRVPEPKNSKYKTAQPAPHATL